MARYTGPVCRICRREGMKLYLKVIVVIQISVLLKEEYAPGQHGQRRLSLVNMVCN